MVRECRGLILIFSLLVLILHSSSPAQQPAELSLDAILKGVAESRESYINEFKNLLSEETKTFSIYDKKGGVKKSKAIQSTFIVYQLSKNEKSIAEFRNVITVDGKKVENADKRAQTFFEAVTKAESSVQELERIENEGSRFDEQLSVNGLTLYQAPVLAENLRPYFDFRLTGTETVNGRPVYVISYDQNRASPYVSVDLRRRTDDGKLTLIYEADESDDQRAQPRLRGKLWIDADMLRVRREERILSILQDGGPERYTVAESTFEFQDSEFNILTPKTIVFTQFRRPRKNDPPVKEVSIKYEYQNFTKPDVQVKSADVKSQ